MTARSSCPLRISATLMALMLFYARPAGASMPLTDTVYTIPEGEFEITAGADLVRTGDLFRRERASLGFGVLDGLSVWFGSEYLHRETGGDDSGIGDSFLRVWYYLGDAAGNRLHAGISAAVRIPTGPSVYDNPRWYNLSRGINELAVGTAVQYELGKLYIHGSANYTFRQGQGEDFYGGFNGNISEKKTWASAFGLNPLHEGAFMQGERLRNDFASASVAANTLLLRPAVPYVELYASHRVYRRVSDNDRLPLEGSGVNPVLGGAGCRFFIGDKGYLEAYVVAALLRKSGYIREIFGISAALQF